MRWRKFRILPIVGALASLMLGITATPAHAELYPDAYTQIVNHQIPVEHDGAPSYWWFGWGRHYAGPNGMEIRMTNSGTTVAIRTIFAFESAGVGLTTIGPGTTIGDAVLAGVSPSALRQAIETAGIVTGPVVGDTLNQLALKNLCLGVTIPNGALGSVLDRAVYLMSAQYVDAFKGPYNNDVKVWLEPCSSGSVLADTWVNVSLPGVQSVVVAQPIAATTGNPFGFFDEAGMSADKAFVRGWAIDPDTTGATTVHTYIDGNLVGATTANTPRPDVGAAYPGYGNNHGYYAEYPVGVGVHQVCTYAINTGPGDGNPQLPSCKTVQRPLLDTRPAAVMSPTNVGQIFYRGINNDLETWWQTAPGSNWSGPLSLGSCVTDSPAAITAPNGVIAAFVRGCGGDLKTTWQTGPGSKNWNWASLGGNFTGSPAVVQTSTGVGQVFVRGTGGDLQTYWQSGPGSGWNGPLSLGGTITDAPAAIIAQNGVVAAFARGAGGDLQTWWQTAPGSGSWSHASLGGNFNGSPTVIQFSTGQEQVFVRGPNNDLETFWQQTAGGTWQGPLSIGGQISGSIAALVTPDGKGTVFVGGINGDLLTFWQPTVGGNWTAFASIGGSASASPAVSMTSTGFGETYIRGINGDMTTSWQQSAGSNWTGPLSLGGTLGR